MYEYVVFTPSFVLLCRRSHVDLAASTSSAASAKKNLSAYEEDLRLPESGSLVQGISVDPHSAVFGKNGVQLLEQQFNGQHHHQHHGLPDVTPAASAVHPASSFYYNVANNGNQQQPHMSSFHPSASANAFATTQNPSLSPGQTSAWGKDFISSYVDFPESSRFPSSHSRDTREIWGHKFTRLFVALLFRISSASTATREANRKWQCQPGRVDPFVTPWQQQRQRQPERNDERQSRPRTLSATVVSYEKDCSRSWKQRRGWTDLRKVHGRLYNRRAFAGIRRGRVYLYSLTCHEHAQHNIASWYRYASLILKNKRALAGREHRKMQQKQQEQQQQHIQEPVYERIKGERPMSQE